jgi:hypothetical protein
MRSLRIPQVHVGSNESESLNSWVSHCRFFFSEVPYEL